MDSLPLIQIIILAVLILSSGFFSSSETAFTSVNKIQVQPLADEGDKRAKRVIWILENKSKMLSAILIGNNIVNIAASALTTTLTIKIFGNVYIGLATGLLTVCILIFGEILPKSIATSYALTLAMTYSWVVYGLIHILNPIIFIVEHIRLAFLKIFKLEDNPAYQMTEDEFMGYVDEGREKGAIEEDEFQMINNVFSLDTSLARDIMVPRIDMTFVQLSASREELLEIYGENNYTRYPVYNDNRDTVIGIVNVKDLLTFPEDEPFFVGKIMREPHFTFEHKEVGTLLMEMRQDAISMVMVLDEYGAVTGLVTLEDILEEIVGEIRDEYDVDEKDSIRELKEGIEYLIEGSTNLEDVNEALGSGFISEEYDSIGGFLIEYLDRLPKSGESIELDDGTKIIAEVVRKNRIEKVHIILSQNEETDEDTD